MLLGSYKFMNRIPFWWIVLFINVSPLVIFILSFSVPGSCQTICDPMNCSTPTCPVLHYLTELAQTHVHCQWCHPTISSSVIPFSSCLQSFPASGSFLMSRPFASGGQSTGVWTSISVLPMNTQDWSPCSPRDSQESPPTPQFKGIKLKFGLT